MNKNRTAVLVLVLAAGCGTNPLDGPYAPPMAASRKVSEQDCGKPISTADGGNLMCLLTESERRAKAVEDERQARIRKEAEERAERERLERERAEQLAREEAARQQRAAEAERLAAERRRLEAEAAAAAAAAAAAQAERERLAKAEAEAGARQRADQEAREAAERECKRREQEWSDGRALLASFVAKHGKAEEFKEIAGQISAFLDKAQKPKPCPPPG